MTAGILLIDDHPLFRSGVAQLVRADPELELVGEAGDGATGIALAEQLQPALILIDLNMKQMNGIETLRALKARKLRSRCVMLTVSDDGQDVLEAMRAGADGYLLKDLEPEELSARIKQAVLGQMVIEGSLAGLLTEALNAPPKVDASDLTDREREILGLLADGRSNKEIARVLGIADATVKVHIKHLLRKLNVKSRLEAAVWALQNPHFRQPITG
ncbi:two-component system response regulator NarL [Derxia lacustris]|uniref:two-component system response regulator NarL n=1 Tax=Derxia lacustris TaxID=764842 RepID=UPI000A16D53F|nr:two-component system response regulator NarL [Derxia lacustris]